MSNQSNNRRLYKRSKKGKNKYFHRRLNQYVCAKPYRMDNIKTSQNDNEDEKHDQFINDRKQEMNKQFDSKYDYICDIGTGAFSNVVKVKPLHNASNNNNPYNKPNYKLDSKHNELLIYGFVRALSQCHKIIIPFDIIQIILFWHQMHKIKDKIYIIKIMDYIFLSSAKAKRFLWEIRILRTLSPHPCIAELVDIVPPENPLKFNTLSFVFEFMPSDLKQIFRSDQYFNNLQIKYILYQILLGLKCMHKAGIIHRDLKPEHLLIDEECTIKICGFRLARSITEIATIQAVGTQSSEIIKKKLLKKKKTSRNDKKYKHRAPVRWYRAPEVLLQPSLKQSHGIDIWSVGCIFGELLQMNDKNVLDYKQRNMLFPGKACWPIAKLTDDSPDYECRMQLNVIFNMIGTPHSDDIEKYTDKKVQIYLNNMVKSPPKDLGTMFPAMEQCGIQLLTQMLRFNADKRISIGQAIKSQYFDEVRDEIAEERYENVERFEFENIETNDLNLRALILDAVCFYNPEWKRKLKQIYKEKKKQLEELKNQMNR